MNHFPGEAFLNLGTPYLFREIGGQTEMTGNSFETLGLSFQLPSPFSASLNIRATQLTLACPA
jgi:hypothetical protein